MKWGIRRTPEQLGHKSIPNKAEQKTSRALSKVGTAAAITGLAVIGGYALSQIAASESGKKAIKQGKYKVGRYMFKQYLSANGHKDSGLFDHKLGRNLNIKEVYELGLEDFIDSFDDHLPWFLY